MNIHPKVISAAVSAVAVLAVAAPAWAGLLDGLGGIIGGGGGGTGSTPEIDPSLLGGTVTVLVGGLLMLAEKRRRS